jgi:hypothetical protein
MDYVEQKKQAHDKSTPGAPYLSTQDIITTWFFCQWETAAVGVAYDLRGRAKGVTEKHVGNYQDALVLFPKEYQDPVNIRRAIASQGKSAPRANRPGKKNPRSVGGITGWHSHFVDLSIPYAERKSHAPLRDASGEIPGLSDPPKMVLFRTSTTQYAMWTATKGEIKDRSAMGEEIDF